MISRRAFLGASALTAALHARPGALLASPHAAVPQNWTRSFDVLVVGGGGAGLAAAASASSQKVSVCLIEKLSMVGGDTLRSTGYLSCVEPRRQTLHGISDSLELHYQQTMQAGRFRANPEVVRRMVKETPATVKWLEQCGVIFQDAVYEIYGSDYQRCLKPVLARGTAYVRALSQRAMAQGVTILLDTALSDIYFDEKGRAVGIRVRGKNGLVENIRADRGIILACGGFGANDEMVARHAPALAGLPTDNSPGSTGDALFIAQKHGIGLEGLAYVECVAGNPPGRKTHARLFIPSDFILVNEEGKRFVEEDALRLDLTEAILQQPNRRAFTVFDSQGVSHLDPISQKGLYQALVADEAMNAESLAELARMLGVQTDTFVGEVKEYNRIACEANRTNAHSLEGKNKCTRIGCTPLIRPPFWAYETGLTVHYTPGGIVINADGQCLRNDGSLVEGLWAAGEVTGSVHGANRLGGNGLADALTFGRLTGLAAAG